MSFSKSGLKRYFANTAWMFFEKLLKFLDGLIIGAYVARYLGPADFGLLSYAISISVFLSVFSNLGMGQIVTLNLLKNPENKDGILGSAFFLKIISFISGYFLIILYFGMLHNNANDKYIVDLISFCVFFECFRIIDFYFRSKVKSVYSVISSSISLIISASFKLYLIFIKANIMWFGISIVLEKSLIAGFLIFFFQLKNNIFCWKIKKETAKLILLDCWPLIISGIAITIYMRIDQIMIKEMIGASETGQYSSAILISSSIFAYPMIICNSVFPAIVRAKSTNIEFFNLRMQQLHDFLIWTIIPSALLVSLISKPLILTMFGENYLEAIPVLKIHIWSTIFVAWGLSSSSWYILNKMTKLALIRNLCGAFINICFNYILIRRLGIIGAAYASLISYFFAYYLFDMFLPTSRNIFLIKSKSLFAPIRYLNR